MSQRTILMVENDPAFRQVRVEFLEEYGFKVLEAESPGEALRIVQSQHCDIVLLDVRLFDEENEQDISGLKLAADLPPYLYKIILTGHDPAEARRRAMQVYPPGIPHPVEFVSKQDGTSALLAELHKVINLMCVAEAAATRPAYPAPLPKNTKVFVVHGHDLGAKDSLARFLEKRGFECVILVELAGDGRTIIEQLEKHSDVGFVIALLTPDDFGYSKKESHDSRRARARQNVIFEFGYFVGKLGRPYVRMLYKADVDLMSDVHGVVYTEMDAAGAWEKLLLAELKSCGYKFNKNGRIMKPKSNSRASAGSR